MAKKRHRKRSESEISRKQRDVDAITKADRLLLSIIKRSPDVIGGDRRRWRPPIDNGYRLIDGRGVNYDIRKRNIDKTQPSRLRHKIGFRDARRVTVCIRRKERRETLFALGKTGMGARSKKRRLTDSSKVRC